MATYQRDLLPPLREIKSAAASDELHAIDAALDALPATPEPVDELRHIGSLSRIVIHRSLAKRRAGIVLRRLL